MKEDIKKASMNWPLAGVVILAMIPTAVGGIDLFIALEWLINGRQLVETVGSDTEAWIALAVGWLAFVASLSGVLVMAHVEIDYAEEDALWKLQDEINIYRSRLRDCARERSEMEEKIEKLEKELFDKQNKTK